MVSNIAKILFDAVLQVRAKILACLIDKVANKNVEFLGPAFRAVFNSIACQSSRVLGEELT